MIFTGKSSNQNSGVYWTKNVFLSHNKRKTEFFSALQRLNEAERKKCAQYDLSQSGEMCTHDNICSSIHMQYFLFKLMRDWESVSPWSYFRATASYIVGIEREIVSRRVDECKCERRVLRSQCWARVDCMEPVERPYDIMYTQMTLNIYTKHQVFLFSLDLLWTSSSSSTAGELKDRDGWYIGFPPR